MNGSKTNRSHWLNIRLTEEEKQFLSAQTKATTCRNASDYARQVLLKKPVLLKVRNESQDELLAEITRLRNELKAIGTNLNQAAKKLNALYLVKDMEQWLQSFQVDKQSLEKDIEGIDAEVKRLVRKWLPL